MAQEMRFVTNQHGMLFFALIQAHDGFGDLASEIATAASRLQVEFARPAVHRAAWSVAHDVADRARDVSMAKAMASDAALHVAGAALQCHGAIGYTVEYDLHLWMKRAWVLGTAWGDARWHRARVGRAIL